TDFVARIFQHELDHLDGILFTDRILDPADLYTEAEYRQII
ncbi:MAG: peptide deformylase, partial [Cyanobacteria bacterium P01_A01_bin.40]